MPLSLRSLVVALLVLLSLALPVSPAHADSTAPRLVSAERTSPDEVGGGAPISVAWSATDESEPGSGVVSAYFSYEGVDGAGAVVGRHTVTGAHLPLADGRSRASQPLTLWGAQGHYTLSRIDVGDAAGNMTTYWRDGTVSAHPAVAAPPPSDLDFAALDFDVVNPLSDTATPTVQGLAPVSRTVAAGEPVVLTSDITDDVSGAAGLYVLYTGPSGVTQVNTTADPALAAAGLTSAVLPLGAEGGTWRATSIRLEDRAGNTANYFRDREPIFSPSGVRPHVAQQPIDFASLDVDVVPKTPDAEAPTLTDVRRDGPAQLHREDDVVLTYTAHDQSALKFIQFDFVDRSSHIFMVRNQCLPERGYASAPLPLGLDTGRIELLSISVVDELFNVRQYRRDGTVWTQGRLEPDPLPGIDLAAFDVDLVDGPPSYTGHLHTGLGCPSIPKLPVTLPESAAAGDVVDVVGEVLLQSDVPLPGAAVAVFAEPAGATPDLVGIVTTDDSGAYSVPHVIGSSDTTYRVRFLGRSGAVGAEPTTGTPRTVDVDGATAEPSPSPTREPDAGGASASVTRLAGPDRVGTAVTISRTSVLDGAAGGVVLTRSDDYGDALAGTALAAARSGPLLLTPTTSLDPRVLDEVRRVLPAGRNVYLLGGERALSRGVEQALREAGYAVVRIAGSDRYATATAIADRVTPTPQALLLSTGRSYADALSAGTAAASVGGVVLLTDGGRLPAATSDYLVRHSAPRYAVGGPAAAADPTATRLVGRDRYETALLTARRFPGSRPAVGLATGEGFADALAGGAHAARMGATLLLTPRTALPASVEEHLLQAGVRDVFVYGGAAAVDERVLTRLRSVVGA